MAIAFRSTNGILATDWTSATRSPAVNKPSGVANGDLLLMILVTNTTTNLATPIAGWTRIGVEQDSGADVELLAEDLVPLRTQLGAARWVATPVVAALVAGVVTLLIKRFGG